MDEKRDFLEREGIRFVGRTNAFISHELKNVMAIVSETAGLMEDLVALSVNGTRELDIHVFKKYCGEITKKVRRGFSVIKDMNRFAHSVDKTIHEADFLDILDLVINLARYSKFTGNIRYNRPNYGFLKVKANILVLENLLYRGLQYALETVGPDDEIMVEVIEAPPNINIVLAGLGAGGGEFPTAEIRHAAGILRGEAMYHPSEGSMHLTIPVSCDG